MNQQKIGLVILIVSVLVLSLLFYLKFQTDKQMLTTCEQSCGNQLGLGCTLDSCPYHQGNSFSWVIVSIGALVALLGGTGLYLSLPQKKEKIIEEKEYDLTSLNDEEKAIFLYIKEHNTGVYQSSIPKQFNLSKVQATRLLDKFEGLELIERRRRGLSNLIVIK